ncbi:hypothetical protein [Methylomonas rapida]|uniref:Uncharacterized protein n=1 Tax=Methylomonas rapida TaxID=2963939 RepID=A0ABY7GLY6_9GAMM|nr:hypothetical protein [Methylomonas rapida]WAR45493.1 hypothetical protein NM686_002975 [Methylomonas rapida]
MNATTLFLAAIIFYAAWVWIAKKNGQSGIIQWAGGFLATTVIFSYIGASIGNVIPQQPTVEIAKAPIIAPEEPQVIEADYQATNQSQQETQPSEDEKRQATLALIRSFSLQDVITLTKPQMEDIQGEGVSKGTALLAFWATASLKWNELMALPNSKHGLIMKDSSTELGKRLCVKGLVIEIARDKSVEEPLFTGGMLDNAGRIYRFAAVGSTGDIVGNSHAGFCGIVTGQQHYANSIGGVAHAVMLVGLFDLPENKPAEVKAKKTKGK